jgi:hypothetical protein
MPNPFCEDPICYKVTAEAKNFQISNLEVHGDIWCHLGVGEGAARDGAKKKADEALKPLNKTKDCKRGCRCIMIEVFSTTLKIREHVHRHHVWDSNWFRGNCRVTFDVEFDVEIHVWLGVCVDPARIEECAKQIAEALNKLKELGKTLEGLTDPEELAKRLKAVTPRQLREGPNVEPPKKVGGVRRR